MQVLEITQMLGNVGEFVGSFAVLATLVYLSLQVREARKVARLNAAQSRADARVRWGLAAVDPTRLSEILGRLNQQLEAHFDPALSYVANVRAHLREYPPADLYMLSNWVSIRMVDHRNVLYQLEQGNLPERFDLQLELEITVPLAQALWGDPPERDDDPLYTMGRIALRDFEQRVEANVAAEGGFRLHQTRMLHSPPTRGEGWPRE